MNEIQNGLCHQAELKNGVLRITFNQPDKGNVIPAAAVPQLTELFEKAQAEALVRCILIDGQGKVFSAGGDVGAFLKSVEQSTAERQSDFARRLENAAKLVMAVVSFSRPIIAAIRGAVAGGGLLYPLAADYVIGDESATFVFAHQRVGLSPDCGVTYLLPQIVGHRTSRSLILSAAKVDAAEALRLRLLSQIVPAGTMQTEAAKIAGRFAQAPQRAVISAKRLIGAASERLLAEQLKAEADAIIACVGDPDFAEGVRALIEKRPAVFPSARE